MALKVLILRKKIDEKKKALEALNGRSEEFVTKESELTEAIEEAETEEEKQTVEEAVNEFEDEKAKYEEEKAELDSEVRKLEEELHALEEEQEKPPAEENVERKDDKEMVLRDKFGVTDYIEREDVKAFLSETRDAIKEKRAITGVGALIPEVFLGLLRENVINYSKLYKHVTVKNIDGEGRMVIMGSIPEAVWTDCCANLNELDLGFYTEEFDCWKLGGYFAICNATLEDSDINLANELLTAIGQAIGYALDKAILYGTGTRMPQGIVARLAETSAPAGYPETARPWVDLHTTNIKSITAGTTGAELIAEIVGAFGSAKSVYGRGVKVFAMNETTYTSLVSAMVAVNTSGAIVTGLGGTMPVIGGAIEVLNFIPDNVIIGGYFDLYTLVERAGKKFATSEHVRFLQDQTVFKGTARYDGAPTIAEAFVAIGLNGVTPDATMTFAPDVANTAEAPADPEGV